MRKTISILAVMAMVFGVAALAGAVQPDFVEDFEDGNVDGWYWNPAVSGAIEAVATPVSPSGGNFVGKVAFGSSCYNAYYAFDPATPDYISWYFRADGDTGHPSGLALALLDSTTNGWMVVVSYHQGALRYHIDGWDYAEIMPASTGTWYLIELRNLDWDSDTFDIWVDGVEKVAGVPFRDAIDSLTAFYNYACPSASGPSYVDDITFDSDSEGPVVTDVAASPNPAAVAQPVTLSATLDDGLTGNSMIAAAEYTLDGGTTYMPMSASDGAFDASTEAVEATLGSFDTPDVHMFCVRGTDSAGNTSSEECAFLAVYDPTAGFVTGGGWIYSNPGDYVPAPSLEGKATFGFVSKYKKGATIPDGNTEFQFQAGDLNFHSDSYDWLVIAGFDRAKYKGVGAINGSGNYEFMLTAVDNGNSGDTFRIKIWDKDNADTVVYDNKMGGDDSYDGTVIGGGNIKVHKK